MTEQEDSGSCPGRETVQGHGQVRLMRPVTLAEEKALGRKWKQKY